MNPFLSQRLPIPAQFSNFVTADSRRRSGKVLVLLMISLPCLFGIAGMVIDGGVMMSDHRLLQHAADAASTAAAMNLQLGKSPSFAENTANDVIHSGNHLSGATVTVHIPPISGLYAGQARHAEVVIDDVYESRCFHILDGVFTRGIEARSVAGVENSPAGAAIVVLDPDPNNLTSPGVDDTLSAVDTNGVGGSAVNQTGVSDYLASIPIVGATANTLINTSLASLLPSIVTAAIDNALSTVSLPALPTLTAGMETEGLGQLRVNGAIHVNTQWGGVDENGKAAGSAAAPPYGMACMPLVAATNVLAKEIRVVGGVDNQAYYLPYDSTVSKPLQANRLAVPDPLASVPIPSTTSDATNVNASVRSPSHAVRVALTPSQANSVINLVANSLPLALRSLFTPLMSQLSTILTQPTLQPGVYDSITVISTLGGAKFLPGVYVIRNISPLTNVSLCIVGPVEAEGVLFYITDSAGFNPTNGQPDAGDDSSVAPANVVTNLLPSTLILTLTAGSRISGLSDPTSPFNGMLIYQRRLDRRPIIVEAQQLLGGGNISGTIYSKWGHTIFLGGAGTYDLRFVTGTMRFVTVTNTTISPTQLFPPAQNVLLLE